MELSAIIWPVYDDAGVILRFFARAYAIHGPDDLIGRTLNTLAPRDYVLAAQFALPSQFMLSSEHGDVPRCTTVRGFKDSQWDIISPALTALEQSFAKVQGIASDALGVPFGVGHIPRFPEEPYLLFVYLHEGRDGRLEPQLT